MARELNAAQQKAQKKKITILVVMVVLTALTWSRTLFGKGKKTTPPPTAAAATTVTPAAATPNTSVGPSTTNSTATAASGVIRNYEQAVSRLELWPAALKRQVHTGAIEELTPINDLLNTKEDVPLPTAPLAEAPPAHTQTTAVIDFRDLRLKLTTTARFGNATFAVINGERVQEGQTVVVQVGQETVRYVVRAIGTREVELSYGDSTYTLRIELPGLLGRDQDGA